MNSGTASTREEAALHHQRGHAEVGGNVLDGPAFLDQRGERLELVGRVHLLAQQVFREADGTGRSVRHQQARYLKVGGNALPVSYTHLLDYRNR